jgi:REP element-mobilizing transposase RayT
MPRPKRIQVAGGIHHVTVRGVRREPIYRGLRDRQYFGGLFGAIALEYDWRGIAYCQMTNHAHFVFETRQANLSAGMQHFNGRYAQWFNETHGVTGHLFERRFSSMLIESERHLLVAAGYVVLNPVRAGMVVHPGDWPWSSYRATIGAEPVPPYLDVGWLSVEFGGELAEARLRYRDFVELGLATADQ